MAVMNGIYHSLVRKAAINLARQNNNFDLLRLLAASMVLLGHSPYLFNGTFYSFDPFHQVFGVQMGTLGVQVFFIISGFLVAMSWEHNGSFMKFIASRAFRVFPALIVVVLLSVFVMGIAITDLPAHEYLKSKVSQSYLKNATLFRMSYHLPGVFANNHETTVNGSLWTLPYEFTCYLLLALLGLMCILKKKYIFLLLFVLFVLGDIFCSQQLYKLIIPIIGTDIKTLYPFMLLFFSGSLFYLFRKYIGFSLLGAIMAIATVFLVKGPSHFYLSLIALPYIVLAMAFSKKLRLKKLSSLGDLSYGIYLYAFPVQQLIIQLCGSQLTLVGTILLSFIFTMLLALFSWHVIEHPCLKLKNRLLQRI